MTRFLPTFIILLFTIQAISKPVNESLARKVAQSFLVHNNTNQAFKTSPTISLAYTSESDGSGPSKNYYYVYNTNGGFIIISADDQVIPVLGYSFDGNFDVSKMPHDLIRWLDNYKNQIDAVITNNIPATSEIKQAWSDLFNPHPQTAIQQSSTGVAALTKTQWDQLPYFNDMCPFDNIRNRHAVTGCVATAMAQLMKYYNYPSYGLGFHSYNDNNYGTQSVSFGSTTYAWTSMPVNNLSSANAAVATLMYHCGVGVDMNYGVDESNANVISASSASKNCAEYALKTYFGYKANGISRKNYTDANWISLLKKELDSSRPVIYAGIGTGGGHCFICDGYNADNTFHFNWGWGGLYNGNFAVSALNPSGIGTGGGSGNYNDGQQAIIGITPSNALINFNLSLTKSLNTSATTITYGQPFTITTNLKNNSTNNFKGDFCAAIFDNTNTLVDSVILSAQSLAKGTSFGSDMVLKYPGSPNLLPGSYTIGLYYRTTGGVGNWSLVASSGSFTNNANLSIIWSNDLELDAALTVAPNPLVSGSPLTLKFNVRNTKSTPYSGHIMAYLYDPVNNMVAFTIKDSAGVKIAPTSNISGGISFKNTLQLLPGSYLLVIYFQPDGDIPKIMGSTNFQNPLKITVKAAILQPDKYERNNTVDSAYVFNPVFVSDSAHINTTGSNCHIGSDLDYYKIMLPAGYYYKMRAHLDNASYNTNGLFYSLEAVVSYSEDGKNWSQTYDNDIPYDLVINGPGFIYFKVAPYFSGQTGTYLLETKMKRFAGTGIQLETNLNSELQLFPNPAKNKINIAWNSEPGNKSEITVFDMNGKTIFTDKQNTVSKLTLETINLNSGLYIIRIQTNKGIISGKFSVEK